MQKRFLTETMKQLHLKFRQENPEVKISYAEFCRQRPFWVVKPTLAERETCLCKLHSNMQFMANRLFFHKIIKTSKLTDLINSVSCDDVTKECMYRECLDCRDKKLETSAFDDGEQTWWFQWRSIVEDREKKKKDGSKEMIKVHSTAKEKVHGPMHKLSEDFSYQLTKKMGKHIQNIKHQYLSLKGLKENIKEDSIVLQIDFAENYICKYAEEIQATYYGDSHKQTTLHTGVAHSKNGVVCICTISECMLHDPSAIWAHLKKCFPI